MAVQAVEVNIRLAEGERRHWWSPYRYQDQITAIVDLGNSGSGEALRYLEEMYTPVIIMSTDSRVCYGRGGVDYNGFEVKFGIQKVSFPNAKRDLYRTLEYTIPLEDVDGQGRSSKLTEDEIESHRATMLRVEPHTTIRKAISQLRMLQSGAHGSI